LEDELLKAKDDFENLEKQLNSAHSSKLNSSKPVDCENCAVLQSKVSYLISNALKLSMDNKPECSFGIPKLCF